MRIVKRLLSHIIVLLVAFLVSFGAYAWWTEIQPERYNLFDFLRGEKVPDVPAKPQGSAQVPPETASFATTGPPTLLAQIATQAATDTKPAIRAQPISPAEIDPASIRLLTDVNRAMADLTDAVVPAVVSIDTSTTVNVRRYVPVDPFGLFGYQSMNEESRQPGLGSGVFVSSDGYVLTNHHVIAGVDEIQITTHEGEKFEAEWVGSDPGVDIAVLKLKKAEERTFPHLKFADSDQARVGEMVLAVGNPFGLTESVTRGIISAKQRRLSDGSNEYFQTDTVINPGNSGGPLVNVLGEIIGINVALFTGQQNVRVWQGVGLAVPSNEARSVFEAIAFDKPLLRGYLGIELTDVTNYLARMLKMSSVRGAVIVAVQEGSPAHQAELKPGDVILNFAGKDVTDAESVMRQLRRLKTDTSVALKILRKGETLDLSARVIEKPDDKALSMRGDAAASGQSLAASLGVEVRNLSDAERSALHLTAQMPAIVISAVDANSEAARRFRVGDLIHGINRDPIHTADEFYEMLSELPARQSSVLILSRRGQRYHVLLQANG